MVPDVRRDRERARAEQLVEDAAAKDGSRAAAGRRTRLVAAIDTCAAGAQVEPDAEIAERAAAPKERVRLDAEQKRRRASGQIAGLDGVSAEADGEREPVGESAADEKAAVVTGGDAGIDAEGVAPFGEIGGGAARAAQVEATDDADEEAAASRCFHGDVGSFAGRTVGAWDHLRRRRRVGIAAGGRCHRGRIGGRDRLRLGRSPGGRGRRRRAGAGNGARGPRGGRALRRGSGRGAGRIGRGRRQRGRALGGGRSALQQSKQERRGGGGTDRTKSLHRGPKLYPSP